MKEATAFMKPIRVGRLLIGGGAPLSLIAGPCVIEDEAKTLEIARYLKELTGKLEIPFIFKASYDKANRTSRDAYRGPGLIRGLEILQRVREEFDIPVLSDVHAFRGDRTCRARPRRPADPRLSLPADGLRRPKWPARRGP